MNDKYTLAIFAAIGVIAAVVYYGHDKIRWSTPRRATASKSSCIANLKQIDGAVQQWASENKGTAATRYSLKSKMILAYMKGSRLPLCPQGGSYSPGTNVSDSPKCTHPGHTL
jgi:hypothetical protein